MSMFRRPTDDSSESDSTSDDPSEDETAANSLQDDSHAGSEGVVGPDLVATETLSSGESISVGSEHDTGAFQNVEHHRNMIMASLLEDFYRSRAVEFFNASHPGAIYHRESPEVQPLAQSLFAQASQDLAGAGILPVHAASNGFQNVRKQYLVGFENLGLQNLKDRDLLPESMKRRISHDNNNMAVVKSSALKGSMMDDLFQPPLRDLAIRTQGLGFAPHPANDLQLATSKHRGSHYQSNFRETCLLGKGGFGRVYQTYNFFDQREYAVKKIPLSPKLSQRYRDHGHGELRHVLREVQALAQLDHCNVVRYHATWIEEPSSDNTNVLARPIPAKPLPKHKLLENVPAFQKGFPAGLEEAAEKRALDGEDDILFANSHASKAPNPDLGWSQQQESLPNDQSSVIDSDIFTDGVSRRPSQSLVVDDPCCYVLHVQMSMYPMTLTQYLQTGPTGTRRGSLSSGRRHCFHVVPSLKILLGILSGLQYVHAKGLIHRDIKPSNIFLSSIQHNLSGKDSEGFLDVGTCFACKETRPYFVNPRIGDFGLVADLALNDDSLHESPSNSSNKFVGTQFYQPPARNNDQKNKSARIIDEKLDIFALGVILTELLCPCATHMERLDLLRGIQEGNVRKETLRLEDAQYYDEQVGKLVKELIQGMTDPDRKTRWSCSEVQEFVQKILRTCNATSPL